MEYIKDLIKDNLLLLIFLFIAFYIIEYIENKANKKTINIIKKSKNYGPLLGGILGATPQCGLGVMATNLYITKLISIGTLISIYLSTSDEMLLILIGSKVELSKILIIIFIKILVGIIFGFIIDFIYMKSRGKEKIEIDAICKEEHCHCEDNILKSATIHTLKTFAFILIITILLDLVIGYIGEDTISNFLINNKIVSPFLASLVGLIPNCAASVVITELYISNLITFGTMIAGLLTGSGVALLVLFKSNKSIKDSLTITVIIYSIGVFIGILFNLINFNI